MGMLYLVVRGDWSEKEELSRHGGAILSKESMVDLAVDELSVGGTMRAASSDYHRNPRTPTSFSDSPNSSLLDKYTNCKNGSCLNPVFLKRRLR